MRDGVPTSTAEVLRYAHKLGWTYRPTRHGYWLTHPDGGQTSFHGSHPADCRAWRNIAARLHRTGPGR